MKTLQLALILHCIIEFECNKHVTSDEKMKRDQERHDKVIVNANRRFNEEQNDEEWHVAHLKETDILENSYCQGETIEEKIRKYKKALLNDGALVSYVSADVLPQNESEIIAYKCNMNVSQGINETIANQHDSNKFQTNTTTETEMDSVSFTNYTDSVHKNLANQSDINTATEKITNSKTSQTDTATTVKLKETLRKKNKVVNETIGDKRRASEYLFSSVEYYDETVDFEAAKCPEAVDVIVLELDQLRSYDVECEMTLEWKSLD